MSDEPIRIQNCPACDSGEELQPGEKCENCGRERPMEVLKIQPPQPSVLQMAQYLVEVAQAAATGSYRPLHPRIEEMSPEAQIQHLTGKLAALQRVVDEGSKIIVEQQGIIANLQDELKNYR